MSLIVKILAKQLPSKSMIGQNVKTLSKIMRYGAIQVIESVKEASDGLFCWFANNQIKVNPDKCRLMTSSGDEVSICFENYNIKSSKCDKLLGIKICHLENSASALAFKYKSSLESKVSSMYFSQCMQQLKYVHIS